MGTVYSDVGTIQNAPTPSTTIEAGQVLGKVRNVAGYATLASGASGTLINLCKLYRGDQVKLGGSWIGTEDTYGSGATVALGDTDDTTAVDADRYLEATSMASAGIVQLNDATACLTKVPYTIQKECWLQATTAGATISGDLRFEINIANNS